MPEYTHLTTFFFAFFLVYIKLYVYVVFNFLIFFNNIKEKVFHIFLAICFRSPFCYRHFYTGDT